MIKFIQMIFLSLLLNLSVTSIQAQATTKFVSNESAIPSFWLNPFDSYYAGYDKRLYYVQVQFNRNNTGSYISDDGFAGSFTNVTYNNLEQSINGQWSADTSQGFFKFIANDVTDPTLGFHGSWWDTDGYTASWDSQGVVVISEPAIDNADPSYSIEVRAQRYACRDSDISIEDTTDKGTFVRINFNQGEMTAIVPPYTSESDKYTDKKICELEYTVTVAPGDRLSSAQFSANGAFNITEHGFLLTKVSHRFDAFTVKDSATLYGNNDPRSGTFDNQQVDIKSYLDGSCGGEFNITTTLESFASVSGFNEGINQIGFDQGQSDAELEGIYDVWNLYIEPCPN
ncbi:hypothetical protein [Shewanella surugensis]|uniref:Uncharacterized protein n=1 Tax=Shewanella surugensis TaxID=212020 RepID=A0ABT0LI01_9GAMM|nr:hypothetical protein [Shewanella surugensis]MCL1127328.1 hypothetical protein [Shewanella surugensis]